MAFSAKLYPNFTKGVVLSPEPDDLPDDALRVARNVRLDRVDLAISSRAGMTKLTAAALGAPTAVDWIGKLYGTSTDYSYAHFGTTLDRLTDAWATPTVLSAASGGTMTAARLPSGATTPVPHIYFASTAGAVGKDNGTTFSTWGIAPPTAAPTGASLATDLSTAINACDSAAQWTGASLASGPTDETAVVVTGGKSVKFTVAASTIGSLGMGSVNFVGSVDLNLDTLTSGDNTVKNDDYIHFWVNIDHPEYVNYLQLDFDLDTATYANAFVSNFYTAVVPQSHLLLEGGGGSQWQKIQIRKSEFNRSGTANLSWAIVKAMRLKVSTNSLGTVTVYIDDFKLRGGVGLEGDISYTVCYRNSTTKGRGNPPITNDIVLYTTALTTDRQRITLDLTNVTQGGAAHPGDTQIDKMWVFRKGGTFADAVKVAEIADTAVTYTDNTSDTTLLLDPIVLETDNDVPPSGTTYVFGPGPFNRLFLIENGYRLRFTKAWERDENRAENVPLANDAGIGDGGQRAIAGLATDTQVFIWTESATYQVLGAGPDTFLPVPIPDSRGIVGPYAVAEGDGRIFFVAQDGLYEQVGLTQRKISDVIDPFFRGQAINGNPALSLTTSNRVQMRLQWFADTNGPFLMILYLDTSSVWRRLIVKAQSGMTAIGARAVQYETFLFDDTTGFSIRSMMVDSEDHTLLGGASNGHVYLLEDDTVSSDDGTAIAGQFRMKSEHFGNPRQKKRINGFLLGGTTGGTAATATAYYDKATGSEALGNYTSSSVATQSMLTVADPTAKRFDAALDLTWSTTAQVIISLLGIHAAPVAELQTFWDSDRITTPLIQRLDRLDLDLDAPADVTLTIYYTNDATSLPPITLTATSGRQMVTYVLPSTIRSRYWRYTLSSATAFEVYTTPPESALRLTEAGAYGTLYDSGRVTTPNIARLDRLEFDLNASAAVTLTLFTSDGASLTPVTLAATSGRTQVSYVVPTIVRSRYWRYTLSSAMAFEFYTNPPDTAFKFAEPGIYGTFFDSGHFLQQAIVRLDRIEFDLNAPGAVTLTVYNAEGSTLPVQTLGPTNGREQVLYIPTNQYRGRVWRYTMVSTSAFELFTVPPEKALTFTEPGIYGTFYDSGHITMPLTGRLDRLEFDIDAPAPVVLTIYDTESTTLPLVTLGPTSGRARVTSILTTEARSRFWRYTLGSTAAFQLYTAPPESALKILEPAEVGTFWDSGPITSPFIEYWKFLEYDVYARQDIMVTFQIDGVPKYTTPLVTTAGRQRGQFALPAPLRGRSHRITLSSLSVFDLYGLLAWRKPVGSTVGYQPVTLSHGQ